MHYICSKRQTKRTLKNKQLVMKQTINVNIGSMAFTLDEDAYGTLKHYLADIERCLPVEEKESIADIERGIAEILREKVTSPLRVITLVEVKDAMARMGRPEDFAADGRRPDIPIEEAVTVRPRLYRSRSNRSIAGICGGLSIWVYIILWIVIPEEPVKQINLNK